MTRWVRSWLRAWRSQPLVVASSLPPPAARERLREGSVSPLRASFSYGGGGGYRVIGRVGERRVSVQAARVGIRNAWRPMVRGRIEPDGTGSRLVGRLGWSPFVRVFSAVWLGLVALAFLGFLANAASQAGNPQAYVLCLVPVGFVVFFVALTSWGIRAGRAEEQYLRTWLADRLENAGGHIPGYQPRA